MNSYKGFFQGKECEVEAETMFQALDKAKAIFKPAKSKRHMVHVGLCEIDGKQVIHRIS